MVNLEEKDETELIEQLKEKIKVYHREKSIERYEKIFNKYLFDSTNNYLNLAKCFRFAFETFQGIENQDYEPRLVELIKDLDLNEFYELYLKYLNLNSSDRPEIDKAESRLKKCLEDQSINSKIKEVVFIFNKCILDEDES